MKFAFALLTATALIVSFSSCDKHSWSETEVLHEGMHKAHGDAHHGDAKGADHAAPGHPEAKPAAAPNAEKKAH